MHILHAASELAPIAKIGGLGDVLYGLARAQQRAGHQVSVLIPKYSTIKGLKLTRVRTFPSFFDGKYFKNTLWKAKLDGISVLLIESDHPKKWFSRGTIYGEPDDTFRFLYFARAVFDYLQSDPPDVLHLHDWQTALLSALSPIPSVLTIHNMLYQGRLRPSALKLVGLPFKEKYRDPKNKSFANLLKMGILESDYITAVSPTYAKEIMTKAYGCGLERTLKNASPKFKGILNGIDTAYWNPATDPHLKDHYRTPQGRAACKQALRKQLGLSQEDRPLLGIVARLVPQKGVDLIHAVLEDIPEMGAQVVLLGDSPIPATHKLFARLSKKHARSPHIRICLRFDEKLAHRIFAGSDLFAVPSSFEPCGLTQMIALRYGSVPVVRKIGGLADTVFDGKNGFTFTDYSPEAFLEALEDAFTLYEDEKKWLRLQKKGMSENLSWDIPARHYLDIYRSIC